MPTLPRMGGGGGFGVTALGGAFGVLLVGPAAPRDGPTVEFCFAREDLSIAETLAVRETLAAAVTRRLKVDSAVGETLAAGRSTWARA